MNPAVLVSDLRGRGVELTVDGGDIRYRAPRGLLTPDVLAQLREHKRDVVQELHELHSVLRGVHVLICDALEGCASNSRDRLLLPAESILDKLLPEIEALAKACEVEGLERVNLTELP